VRGEDKGIHFRLKPHLREFFRHLGVTSRPALKPFSRDQLHRVGFSARVYRRQKWKKREKWKNRVQKMVEIDKNDQKWPKTEKRAPSNSLKLSFLSFLSLPLTSLTHLHCLYTPLQPRIHTIHPAQRLQILPAFYST
jgi:hypothetical protein